MRCLLVLALVGCSDPVREVWIEADPRGIPSPDADQCPGTSCDLAVYDLSDKDASTFTAAGGDETPVEVEILDTDDGKGGASLPLFRRDAVYEIRNGDAVTTTTERRSVPYDTGWDTGTAGTMWVTQICIVRKDQMLCTDGSESTSEETEDEEYSVGTLYMREGAIAPENALEGS